MGNTSFGTTAGCGRFQEIKLLTSNSLNPQSRSETLREERKLAEDRRRHVAFSLGSLGFMTYAIDCMLQEGHTALLRIGLSILALQLRELRTARSMEEVCGFLRHPFTLPGNNTITAEQMVDVAFDPHLRDFRIRFQFLWTAARAKIDEEDLSSPHRR